ncbi:MAG: hypothetical protein EXR95_03430 [Gemmatimonadetes bacterium]|nr:hypothetical protein [Gemmatimonadota bacterium]
MRRSASLLLLCGAFGCEQREWSGPLATAAESAFAGAQAAACDTSSTAQAIEAARPPVRSCRLVRGDTAFAVAVDDRGVPLILTRTFVVEPSRQSAIHDSMQMAISIEYGAPYICTQREGATETGVRIWNTMNRQLALKNITNKEITFELRVDHPGCP